MGKISGKGSFRGVPFLIENEQGQDGGRRLVMHEFPLRDDGLSEDLGLRLRNYHVSCLVIGDDHIKQAEKLIEALEKPDAGTLKHPYFGTKEVRVDDYNATYSTEHQRVTRFDISFVPAVNEIAPKAKKDTLFGVLQQYADAINVLTDEVAEIVEEALAFIDEILDNPLFHLVEAVLDFVDAVFEGVSSILNAVSGFKDKLLSFKGRLANLASQPKLLVRELFALANAGVTGGRISERFGSVSAVNFKRVFVQATTLQNAVQDYQQQLYQHKREMGKRALDRLATSRLSQQPINLAVSRSFALSDQALSEQNVAETLLAKAQFALVRFVLTAVTLEYGKAIAQSLSQSVALRHQTIENLENGSATQIESKGDVQRYMAEIDAQLEQLILAYADNEQWDGYEALECFRLALSQDLRTRGTQLANAKQVQLRDTQPALVVAYEYAEDSRQWAKLCLRNNVRHPLFCLGGENVEVLQ